MMDDNFIESIITPKPEGENAMINRTFHGIETVAQFEEDYNAKNGGEE